VLASKYGMSQAQARHAQARQAEARVAALAEAEELDFTADRALGNTFDAHRLVHFGREQGCSAAWRTSCITPTSARAGPCSARMRSSAWRQIQALTPGTASPARSPARRLRRH